MAVARILFGSSCRRCRRGRVFKKKLKNDKKRFHSLPLAAAALAKPAAALALATAALALATAALAQRAAALAVATAARPGPGFFRQR